MSALTIQVSVSIKTDDRYCDEACPYFRASLSIALPAQCALFGKLCEHCLGGGPLRCGECCEAERNSKEGK